jgi:hypothetical protein
MSIATNDYSKDKRASELLAIMNACKILLSENDMNVTITVEKYISFMTSLPVGAAEKLRFAPSDGTAKRIRHLLGCYKFVKNAVRAGAALHHIEGFGVDYNVGKSDFRLDDTEYDLTYNPALLVSKEEDLRKQFNNAKSVLGPELNVMFDVPILSKFKLNENLIGNVDVIENLLVDEVFKFTESDREPFESASMDMVRASEKVLSNRADKLIENVATMDMAMINILTEIGDIFSKNRRSSQFRYNPVAVTKAGVNFICPMLDAIRSATSLEQGVIKGYIVSEDSFEVVDVPIGDVPNFGKPFRMCDSKYSFVAKGSKLENCAIICFSDFMNFSDVSDRNHGVRREKKAKESKLIVPSELMKEYEVLMDSYTEKLPDEEISADEKLVEVASKILDESSRLILMATIGALAESKVYRILEHRSSIAETVAVSNKVRGRSNEWRLGKDGRFDSWTLVNLTNGVDKYTNCSIITFYRTAALMNDRCFETNSKFITLPRDKLNWDIKLPLSVIAASACRLETERSLPSMRALTEIATYASINRDTFAQCSEQVRYMYMTALSGKDTSVSIYKKKMKGVLVCKTMYEVAYIYRMLVNTRILSAKVKLRSKDLNVRDFNIPGCSTEDHMHSFETMINEFYMCNLFNKAKTFKLNASAINYAALLDEDDIYSERKAGLKQAESVLFGTSKFNEDVARASIRYDLLNGPERFKFNPYFVAWVSKFAEKFTESSSVIKAMRRSPLDFMTLRGAMAGAEPTDKSQSTSSVMSFISGIETDSGKPIKSMESCSIYTLKAINMAKQGSESYSYRVVMKEQKGHREISVLNYNYRIGSLAVESVARAMSIKYGEDMLNKSHKREAFEKLSRSRSDETNNIYNDNNDQSRWGPNMVMSMMRFFVEASDLRDDVKSMMHDTFHGVERKKAKVPEDVLEFILTNKGYAADSTLGKLIIKLKERGIKNHKVLEWGMGQGILHQMSSLYHCLMNRGLTFLMEKIGVKILGTLITSDDSYRRIADIANLGRRRLENVMSAILGLGNILRNDGKSALSRYVAEFNSVFYNKLKLAVPFIKKAIADIDCGKSESLVSDMIGSCLRGVPLILEGSPSSIADITAALSLKLTKDQWNLWSDNVPKSCLRGGSPMISSIVSTTCGGIGNAAITENEDSHEDIINAWMSHLKDPVSEVTIGELRRGASTLRTNADDRKIVLERDIAGVTNLLLYSKKYVPTITNIDTNVRANFVPDIDSNYASGENLHFYLMRKFKNKSMLSGSHDFMTRYVEPKVSPEAKRYKVRDSVMSRFELMSYLSTLRFENKGAVFPGAEVMIGGVIRRALAIKDAILGSKSIKSVQPIVMTTRKIVLERLMDRPIHEVRAELYNKSESSTPLGKMGDADAVITAMMSFAPLSFKATVPLSLLKTPTSTVAAMIRRRSSLFLKKVDLDFSIPIGSRYMTAYGSEVSKSKEEVSRLALSCFSNRRTAMMPGYATHPVEFVSDTVEDYEISKEFASSCALSATMKRNIGVSAEGLVNLILADKITGSTLIMGNKRIRFMRDTSVLTNEAVRTYGRVQMMYENGRYVHHILVDKLPRSYLIESDNKWLENGSDTYSFLVVADSATPVRLSPYCPCYYIEINEVTVPLFFVKPKMYTSYEMLKVDLKLNMVDVETSTFKRGEAKKAIVDCLKHNRATDKVLQACTLFTRFDESEKRVARTLLTNFLTIPAACEEVKSAEAMTLDDFIDDKDFGNEDEDEADTKGKGTIESMVDTAIGSASELKLGLSDFLDGEGDYTEEALFMEKYIESLDEEDAANMNTKLTRDPVVVSSAVRLESGPATVIINHLRRCKSNEEREDCVYELASYFDVRFICAVVVLA